jgi:ABC-type multidrug transport system ATPase subunit
MARPSASAPVQFAEPRAGASAFDVITVDNLSKRFGDFWALRGASFSIRRGEILGLIGPNGSGKTTLFQCFAGIAPATLGVVERDATRVAPDDRKRLLFFVPDGVRPWTDQSVAWTLRIIAGVPPFNVGICLAGT